MKNNITDKISEEFDKIWDEEVHKQKKLADDNDFMPISVMIKKDKKKYKQRVIRNSMGYAAAITLLVAALFFIFKDSYKASAIAENKAEYVSKEDIKTITSNEKAKEVWLPDGTYIKLEPNSKLLYNSNFSKTNRNVTLIGNAFFHVKKNEDLHFMVHTGNLTTEVTGTQFSVKRDTINQITSVFLFNGKVSLYNKKKFIKSLSPQEGFVFNEITQEEVLLSHQSAQSKENNFQLSDLSKNISVTYENIPLQKAYKDWAKNNNVEIDLSKVSFPNDTYITLSLKDKPAIEILEKLNLFYKLSYTRSGNKITLFHQ